MVNRRDFLKGASAAAAVAMVSPADVLGGRHRVVRSGSGNAEVNSDLVIALPERTYNDQFLAQLAEHFRGEVFRKRFDAPHPPRTENWKWGWQLGIIDFGCRNYQLQLLNEFDDHCPDPTSPGGIKQNPQRRLVTQLYANGECDPALRWRRLDYNSALVENATDDDFMRIYNTRRNEFHIDNLKRDSAVAVPGAGGALEKMDRYQESNDPGGLGLNLASQQAVTVNKEHMYQLAIWLQGRNDPWTIYTIGAAKDASGNQMCDAYAITSYLVDFPDGDGTMGQRTEMHKTLAGILHWKEGMLVRTFRDDSRHGGAEIYAGEPAFDSKGRSVFQYGVTNKYKIDQGAHAETPVPVEDLVKLWTGKTENLPVNYWDSGNPVYRG